MTSHNVNLESPNVKTDDAGQVLLAYEEIVKQIQEKIQVGLHLYVTDSCIFASVFSF